MLAGVGDYTLILSQMLSIKHANTLMFSFDEHRLTEMTYFRQKKMSLDTFRIKHLENLLMLHTSSYFVAQWEVLLTSPWR